MKAFTDLLYFEPKISMSDWPLVIEALKVVYPNIRWRYGGQLEPFSTGPCNGLIVTSIKNRPLLSWGVWNNKEDFVQHALGVNWRYGEVKDGREYLGLNEDTNSIFNSLTESELIRRIIKESMDEFDWVDVNPNAYNSGQGLFNLMQDFFQTNGKYYLEQHEFNGLKRIAISDDTGIYYSYHINDFTIDRIKSDIKTTLEELFHNYEAKVHNEYQQLAKALEPIIGPINID